MCPRPRGEGGGSFRNLTWLRTPFILARGGSAARCEEMDWGRDRPDQDPTFSPQSCVFHSRSSVFPQAQPAAGPRDPSGD